jgi:molecular chaperone DnaK
MVRDAQEHAEEDRKRREDVETRNQAEALTFQAERTVKDLGDKVSSEDKLEVENSVSSLREALKGSDVEAIRGGMTSLAEILQRVSTAAYQASASEAGPTNGSSEGGEPGGESESGDAAGAEGAAEGEEAVEGEFKEV